MDTTEFIEITKWIETQDIKVENIETKQLVSIFDIPKLLNNYYIHKTKQIKNENPL